VGLAHPAVPLINFYLFIYDISVKKVLMLQDYAVFGNAVQPAFLKNFKFFFVKIKYGLYVLDCFDMLMSEMIFKK
jgi:hypothetical protein